MGSLAGKIHGFIGRMMMLMFAGFIAAVGVRVIEMLQPLQLDPAARDLVLGTMGAMFIMFLFDLTRMEAEYEESEMTDSGGDDDSGAAA